MTLYSTLRIAVLLIPILCAEPLLAQDQLQPSDKNFSPVQIGIAPESQYHHCFEKPNGARDAIDRLPASACFWLQQDAVYIITPEERCAFLRLETDEERNQFIEQFWYRRASDPTSLDYDFKIEHYRRIVFANEKYGGQLPGWKTDRGKIYVLFGPPDSVDVNSDHVPGNQTPSQTTKTKTQLHSSEKWRYHYIKGLGENVQFNFEYQPPYRGYLLPAAENDLLARADPNPDSFPSTPEHLRLYVVSGPAPIRFKDLEAVFTSQIVRDQVKFTHRVEFAPATQATTLARIDIQISCETCTRAGQIVLSLAYPLFIRVVQPSGWVVSTSELTADVAVADKSDSKFSIKTHLDVPLAPGTYQLAIVAKNPVTGESGVVRTRLDVPTYEALETKN
jgi:GWxTD domain-containing protein